MYCIQYRQHLALSLEECWDFFSCPDNLQRITPSYLGFTLQAHDQKTMYAGQILFHTIRPILNIPINWVTEITHVEKHVYFIDEQRFGPYKFWHHEHRFLPHAEGVEMVDTVYYKMPFGVFGRLIHAIKVQQQIETIFSYRHKKLDELFGLSGGHLSR